eukprot:jgi/Hompol1/667/HPOL_000878-RA
MNKKGQSSSEAPLCTPHLLADPADSLELQDLAGNQPLHLVPPPTLPTPPVSPTTPTDQLLPLIDLPIHPRIMPSLSACPTEVWTRIFSFLDPDSSLKIFPLVSRKALAVSASPSAKALFFLTQYGRGLALYYAYRKHRKALDPLVGKVMLQNGALLPRFVAQKVTSDYHLQLQNGISTALFVFFVNNAYDMYGDLAMFKDNDHTLFERLVRAPLSDAAVSKERVRSLIREYHFTPVDGLCSKPLAENIYFLARLDLSLVSDLVKHGFDLKSVSDSVIERVMLHPYLNVRYLKRYLDVRKVAVLGSRAVGKSSLTVQFVENHFAETYYPTIENTFTKIVKYKGEEYAAEIIDTAGQDEFSIFNSKHAIGIHGYVLVYSIASRQSFETCKIVRDKILNLTGIDWVPIVLVANKLDLLAQRQVSTEE